MRSPEADLLDLHDRFCQGFADRAPDLVLDTLADGPQLVVVTSEEALLRGAQEVRAFLERYVVGTTTYSWAWDRRDTTTFETWGCLLAVGTESASVAGRSKATPYRMTIVAKRETERWAIVQVHGSSPHQP